MMAEEKFLDDIGDAAPPAPEPAASPEPKPAAEPPVKAEAEPAERTDPANSAARPEGYVPRQALEEARREAKEHRDRAAILEDRTNKILERYFSNNPPAQQAEPEVDLGPDPDEDPIGALKWAREQRARDIEERRQATAAHEQRNEQQRQMSQLAQTARSDVQQFKAATPDYDDARLFYWNQRGPELMALGYSQDQAVQMIEQDELSITQIALQRGQSPAATLYTIAKTRGYQGKAAEADAVPPAEVDGAAERMRDATGKFVSPEVEKATRIKTSQERNGSLSGAPGAPVEKMTAKELASLSEEEIWRRFDSVKNSKGKKEFDRRMNFQ